MSMKGIPLQMIQPPSWLALLHCELSCQWSLLLVKLHCLKIDHLWKDSLQNRQFILNREEYQAFQEPDSFFFSAPWSRQISWAGFWAEHLSDWSYVPIIFLSCFQLDERILHGVSCDDIYSHVFSTWAHTYKLCVSDMKVELSLNITGSDNWCSRIEASFRSLSICYTLCQGVLSTVS